jgi:hypothetical protein
MTEGGYRLWLVEDENWDYDELQSAVVWARDHDEAAEMFKADGNAGSHPRLAITPVELKPGMIHAHVHPG